MIDALMPLIKQFLPFAQKQMGFKKPPRLFLKGDSSNAKDPLGKTAFYDPGEKSITLYITGRHPKDVMRSLSHELVHHKQNCEGQFDDSVEMGDGYAQNDEHLREMEREAYEMGNMCFRDWEDGIKSTIYFEHLQKGEKKMSIKDWKNNELNKLLNEAWGFKFNTLQEFEEFDGSGEIQEEEIEAAPPDGAEVQEESADSDVEVQEESADSDVEVQEEGCPSSAEEEDSVVVALSEEDDESPVTEDEDTLEEDDEIEERRARGRKTPANAQGRHDDPRARVTEVLKSSGLNEEQVKEALQKAIAIVKEQKANGQEK